ncbi:MAG: 3-hydroxyacyl-CoA dehydrogenase [Polaromonas sp.]|nr:3-hydroxyacyl-CoA dehydrogenase [Polaromonas sp.]MDP3172433.1 3-hydroxyacyl-CoA dehydrogenase [Polaromonas sp.]
MSSSLREDHANTIAAIVGGGSIGVAFAIVFAKAAWKVRLYDPDAARREAVAPELRSRLESLDEFGLLSETPAQVAGRVEVFDTLAQAVWGVSIVQECAPENLEIKREIFEQLAIHAPATAVLASSSSALPVSQYAPDGPARARCIVAHPGNPPYLIPVIEIVPTPFTDPATVTEAGRLYGWCGLSPVHVRAEVEGFIFNRLQGAVLREAYCLVRDGVATVDDVDTIVRQGLGLRWSFMGPFETVDLNTRGGIASHAQKMGPAYARMGAQRGQRDPWVSDLVADVAEQRRRLLPLDLWEQRVQWRDRMLMRLMRQRRDGTESWPPQS